MSIIRECTECSALVVAERIQSRFERDLPGGTGCAALAACHRIMAKGIHHRRSFVRIVTPIDQGSWPRIAASTKPMGPRIFPSRPTSTIGQCRDGSRATTYIPARTRPRSSRCTPITGATTRRSKVTRPRALGSTPGPAPSPIPTRCCTPPRPQAIGASTSGTTPSVRCHWSCLTPACSSTEIVAACR